MLEKGRSLALTIGLAGALTLILIGACDSKTRVAESSAPEQTVPAAGPVAQPTGLRSDATIPEQAAPQTEPAVPPSKPAEPRVLFDLIRQAAELRDEAGWAALDTEVAALDDQNLNRAIAALEQAVAAAEKAARPAPGLRLALAACYGRKGLAEKAYATVEAAERDVTAPGVVFNLAVIYGRKALLGNALEPCTLLMESDPPGAVIQVDGLVAGVTPLRLEGVRPGTHRVTALLAGYDDGAVEISGAAGASLKAQITLNAAPVAYTVRVEPEAALVAVNGGEAVGGTWRGALRPGTYPVEARLAGYKTLNSALSVPVSAVPREVVPRLDPCLRL